MEGQRLPPAEADPGARPAGWGRLPVELKRRVVAAVSSWQLLGAPHPDREFLALATCDPRWRAMQAGGAPGCRGAVAPYAQVRAAIRARLRGAASQAVVARALGGTAPVCLAHIWSSDSFFAASLADWVEGESTAGNARAGEAATRIARAHHRGGDTLDLSGLPLRRLPACLAQLPRVRLLIACRCPHLLAIDSPEELPPQLLRIDLSRCPRLSRVEGLRRHPSLRAASFEGCPALPAAGCGPLWRWASSARAPRDAP